MDMRTYELIAFIGHLYGQPISRRETDDKNVTELHWYPRRDYFAPDDFNEITVHLSPGGVGSLVFRFVDDRREDKDYALLGYALEDEVPVEGF